MKQTPRTRKINEAVREAIASIVLTEVSDPRLDLVTVTSVEVSSDLSLANVYVTAHGGDDRYQEMLDGLGSAKGRIRSLLGRRVPLRLTPDLRFFIDTTVDGSMRLTEALKDVPPTMREAEPEDSEDAGDLDSTDPARADDGE